MYFKHKDITLKLVTALFKAHIVCRKLPTSSSVVSEISIISPKLESLICYRCTHEHKFIYLFYSFSHTEGFERFAVMLEGSVPKFLSVALGVSFGRFFLYTRWVHFFLNRLFHNVAMYSYVNNKLLWTLWVTHLTCIFNRSF